MLTDIVEVLVYAAALEAYRRGNARRFMHHREDVTIAILDVVDWHNRPGLLFELTPGPHIIDEPYDRAGTPGRACLECNSAWPADEPDDAEHHHRLGCRAAPGALLS